MARDVEGSIAVREQPNGRKRAVQHCRCSQVSGGGQSVSKSGIAAPTSPSSVSPGSNRIWIIRQFRVRRILWRLVPPLAQARTAALRRLGGGPC